jgi:uncharacterized protein YjbJ (UPF0337 family)
VTRRPRTPAVTGPDRRSRRTSCAKGRAKEATGGLTGDDDLKREGKLDRAGGSIKGQVGRATEKIKDMVSRRR